MNTHPVRFKISPVLASANGMGRDAVADCCRFWLEEINLVLAKSGCDTVLGFESVDLALKGADGATYPRPEEIADNHPIVIQIDWNADDASTRGGGSTWVMDGGVGCMFIQGTRTRKLYPRGTSGYVGGLSRLLYTITHELEHKKVIGDVYWQNDLPDPTGFEPNMACKRGSPIHPYGKIMRRDPIQAQTVPFGESRICSTIAMAFSKGIGQGAHKPLPIAGRKVLFRTVIAGVPVPGIGLVTWAVSSSGAGTVCEPQQKYSTNSNGEAVVEWPFGSGDSYLDNRALLVKAIPAPAVGKACGAWVAWFQFHLEALMRGPLSQLTFTFDIGTGKTALPVFGEDQTWPWREFEPMFRDLQANEAVPNVFDRPATTPWIPADASSDDVPQSPGPTKPPEPIELPKVTGLKAAVTEGMVKLSWDNMNLPSGCAYEIWRGEFKAGTMTDFASGYLDDDVIGGGLYSYRVRAVAVANPRYTDGEMSSLVYVQLPYSPPEEPSNSAEVEALKARVVKLEAAVTSGRNQFAEFEKKLSQFKQWVAQL